MRVADPDRLLATLDEIEFKPKSVRRSMRADGSALSVAYADPVLRADGMASDRLGDAIEPVRPLRMTDALARLGPFRDRAAEGFEFAAQPLPGTRLLQANGSPPRK